MKKLLLLCLFAPAAFAQTYYPSTTISPLSYIVATTCGADPTGVVDSTAAINTCLALSQQNGTIGTVYLPPGIYKISDSINVGMAGVTAMQCLMGAGRNVSILHAGANFNPAATGIIVGTRYGSSGVNANYGPCIQNLSIQEDQPPDIQTTATNCTSSCSGNNYPISSTTVNVASVTNMTVGGTMYIYGPDDGAFVARTTITSIAGNAVTFNTPTQGVINSGDNIFAGVTRAGYVGLGTCTATTGGTGCQYPYAINANNVNRIQIENVSILSCWKGISMDHTSTGGGASFQMSEIELGCLNSGIFVEKLADFGHISHVECQAQYGWQIRSVGASQVWSDGSTNCLNIGRADGVSVDDVRLFNANVQILSTFTWGEFSHMELDVSKLFVTGGTLQMIWHDGYINGDFGNGTCLISVTDPGAPIIFSNMFAKSNSSSLFCISGSSHGNRITVQTSTLLPNNNNLAQITSTASGSITAIDNNVIGGSGSSVLVSMTGSNLSIDFSGNNILQTVNGTGAAINGAGYVDTASNRIVSNNLNGWSVPATIPTAGLLGTYYPQINTTGTSIGIGNNTLGALNSANGANSVAVGSGALSSITSATQNVAIGLNALTKSTTGSNNVAVGYLAAGGASSTANASDEVSIGASSLLALTNGASNTAVGQASCNKVTSGANNVCLGAQVGSTTLLGGSGNILIGTSSATDTTATGTSNTINIQNKTIACTGTDVPATSACSFAGNLAVAGTVTAGGGTIASTTPYILAEWGVPTMFPSSGSLGNNGALTGLTTLPATFSNGIYIYFAANQICTVGTGGNAAGSYWTVMSSATAGTVYNNVLSGTPVLVASPTAFSCTGAGAYTQATGSYLTLITISVPGGSLGANGALISEVLAARNGSGAAGTNNLINNYGGSLFGTVSPTTSNAWHALHRTLRNMGNTSVQVVYPPLNSNATDNAIPGATTDPSFLAVNSSNAQNLGYQAKLANAADFEIIYGGRIEIDYAP